MGEFQSSFSSSVKFLWPRVASNGCRTRDEDREEAQHKDPHQHSNQDQLCPRVAKIQGPPQAEALRDKSPLKVKICYSYVVGLFALK